MKVKNVNRMLVVAAISVLSIAGPSLSAGVQRQDNQKHDDQNQQGNQEKQQNDKQKGNAQGPQAKTPPPAQQQRGESRLTQPQQQVRITQQQQRSTQYSQYLGQQRGVAQLRSAQLQQQHRTNQYQFQMLYIDRLNQQQLVMQNSRSYNYGGDPYFYTASTFRYSRGGRYYETNQYGADLLRHGVNYGYDEGYRAGKADHLDHWAFNYRDSYAYQDASFGYSGYYVDRDDYNFYFREGFRRGYEDGYNSRHQYGYYSNGTYSILGPQLSVILNLQSFH
jgi:hypothetical protein